MLLTSGLSSPYCCRREASLDLEVKASGFSKDIEEDSLQEQQVGQDKPLVLLVRG